MKPSFNHDEMLIGPYLEHHGIKGQKWGVRRFQNYDGTYTAAGKKRYGITNKERSALKGAKTYNLESWGKSPETNVLYLTGLSGSGKSTVAQRLKSANTDVIHLDFYLEKGRPEETRKHQSKDFNAFMDKNGIPFNDLTSGKYEDQPKERWALIDRLAKAIDDYGKESFKSGRKVVAEGVQIADQTLYPDEMKSFYRGKPMAIMTTGTLRSMYLGGKRDGIKVYDIPTVYQRYKNQRMWSRNIKNLSSMMS